MKGQHFLYFSHGHELFLSEFCSPGGSDNARSKPRFRLKRCLVKFVVKSNKNTGVNQKYCSKCKGEITELKVFSNHELQHLPQRPLGSRSVLLEVEAGI